MVAFLRLRSPLLVRPDLNLVRRPLNRLIQDVRHWVRHLAHMVLGAVRREASLHLLVVCAVSGLLCAVVERVLGHLVLGVVHESLERMERLEGDISKVWFALVLVDLAERQALIIVTRHKLLELLL